MVGSQDNDDHSYDPPLGELFDFEGYCAEDSAQLESASDAGPPAPSGPGLSGRTTSLNPHENQENPTNAAIESLNNQAAFTDDWFDFLGEPSQAAAETGSEPFPRLNPPLGPSNAIAEIQDSRLEGPEELSQSTETGNEPFHQHGQTSTDIPSVAEIQDLDNEIEDIELRLRLKDLRTKRRRLLQNMPPSQQAQSPQRPESRDDRSPSKLSVGGVLVTNQTESFLNTSQDPSKAVKSQPTGSAQASTYNVGQSQDGTIDSLPGLMDMSYAGFDDQYGLIPTNPSYFNLPDLPNSTPKGPSHLEVIEPSGVAVKDTSGLNVTHVADLPKSVPPVSSNLRVTDHFGMQSSMPNQLPGQPSTYPALSGSLQTQYPDPAQHTSASSLLHQNQPNQTPVRGKAATGKRRRSPQSILGQRIPATRKQNSKPKGVPETFLSTICLNPPPKRPRTVSEKQDKRDVLKAGGACLLCRLFKKKCSGQPPCGTCRSYWQERVGNSTKFMWTCDVRTKLAELNIFDFPLDVSTAEIQRTLDTQFTDPSAFKHKFSYLCELMDSVEPSRPRCCLNRVDSNTMYLYSYAHSIVRHKRALLYLAPKLKHDLVFIERLYRNACLKMLRYCDTMHSSSQPKWAVFLLALIYEELVILNPEQMDSSLLQHLLIAVSSRLTIFSNRLLDLDRSKKSKFTPHGGLADFYYVLQESRLYPRSKDFYDRVALASRNMVTPQLDAKRLHSASCLLGRSDRNECHPDVTHPDGCCCGWTFDSIPSGVLAIFDQCSESLARHFHAKRWTIRFAERTSDVDISALMKEVFEQRDMEKSTLQKKQVIFREALYLSLQVAFRCLTLITSILPITTTEEQLDFRAYENSQLLLGTVLQKAVFLYRRFWESRDKDYPDARGIDELILDFCSWGKFRPEKDTVAFELREILIKRRRFLVSMVKHCGLYEH